MTKYYLICPDCRTRLREQVKNKKNNKPLEGLGCIRESMSVLVVALSGFIQKGKVSSKRVVWRHHSSNERDAKK